MRTGDLVGVLLMRKVIFFIRGRNKSMILVLRGKIFILKRLKINWNTLPYVMESVVVERKNMLVALVFPG